MISIIEGLLIFLIAMIWRIISFKYTHLAERLQLLTLIIIGEGIIGMVKSVACITKSQTSNNMSEIGTVIAAILLLVCRQEPNNSKTALIGPLVSSLDAVLRSAFP